MGVAVLSPQTASKLLSLCNAEAGRPKAIAGRKDFIVLEVFTRSLHNGVAWGSIRAAACANHGPTWSHSLAVYNAGRALPFLLADCVIEFIYDDLRNVTQMRAASRGFVTEQMMRHMPHVAFHAQDPSLV